MASTNLTPADRATRDARIHQLAAEKHSHRSIARQVGVHHTTVARILRTTPAPPERTTTAPAEQPERTTPPTSGDKPAPRLLHPLDPALIQDLNCLADPRTGALPEPIRRYLRAAADHRRASMRATAHHLTAPEHTSGPTPSGRAAGRAQVAP